MKCNSFFYKQIKTFIPFLTVLFLFCGVLSAQEIPFIKAKITVSPEVKNVFIKDGRLILRLTKARGKEPRKGAEITIGATALNWDAKTPFAFTTKDKNVLVSGSFDEKNKNEMCYFQVVYKQNVDDGQENVPGNLYSKVDSAKISANMNINLNLHQLIAPTEVVSNKFIKPVMIKSRLLSEFFGHDRYLKAAILLPSGYFDNPGKSYPICYRAPGLNGRSFYINGLIAEKEFADWWFSKDAPQIIYVFLDSQGPYGDTYQVDSENNGPCGKALTEELIPEIERQVRYDSKSHQRYLTGYSTGGWVAFGLQVFYPDFFDGTWSYSPDPVDFSHFGLIDMYTDETIFYNKYGYLQPGRRTIYGEPTRSMKDWIADENLVGRTGNYLVSGGQFGAYNAVFSPKGKDGLPALAFDPVTGKINRDVAKQWEKYDLKKMLERNWATLGPKLKGKIWIWTGDMDNLYSNVATRFLKDFLDKTENPRSDAKISFTPMAGHCQEWDDKSALMLIGTKAEKSLHPTSSER